jgi:hypothetical protein
MRIVFYLLILLPLCSHARTISITTHSDTVCNGTPTLFSAAATGSTPHYHWKINGANAGTDSSAFVTNSLHDHDSIVCLLTNNTGDKVFATSNSIKVTVLPRPNAGVITGNDTVCVGATIFLSDNIAGGIWEASNNFASVSGRIITGLSIDYTFESIIFVGIDTIYYIAMNSSCADTASKVIAVNAIHSAYMDVPSSVCIGQYIVFPENNNASNIYAVNGNATVSFISVGGLHIGNDVIYNIYTNGCGSDTFSSPIQVTDTPRTTPLIVPNSTICVGGQISLSDAAAFNFYWDKTNQNVQMYQLTAFGIKVGSDTITLNYTAACNSILKTTTVITVVDNDTIKGPSQVCQDNSIQLSNNIPGGVWNNHDKAIATFDPENKIFTGSSPGIDTLSYMLPNGCSTKTAIRINPIPAAIVGDDILCTGSDITLVDTGKGIWSSDNEVFATIDRYNFGQIHGVSKGVVNIIYSYNTGCFQSKQVRIIDCNKEVSIFPNPVKNELIIEADLVMYNSFSIVNCLGQLMVSKPLNQPLTEIYTGSWPVGLYFATIYGDGSRYVTKLLKE